MIKFLFGLTLIAVGFFGAVFIDPIWGIYLYTALTHITLQQLGQSISLPLHIPIVISSLTFVLYLLSRAYPQKFRRWPADVWLLAAMIVALALSSLHATFDPAASWSMTYVYLEYWIFFVLLIQMLNSRKRIDGFHWTLIISAAYLVYRAYSLRGTTGPRFENLGGGYVQDSNEYAAALVLLFPFAYQRTFSETRLIAWGAAICCFGLAMAVIVADSRGGFLGLVALWLAIILCFKGRRTRNIAVLVVVGALVLLFAKAGQLERLETIILATHRATRDNSAELRVEYWGLAWRLFKQHPLLGIGAQNFWYYSGYMVEGLPYGKHGQVTHSLWMELLSGGGLTLTIPFMILLWRFFRKSLRLARQCVKAGRQDIALYFYTPVFAMSGFLVSASFVDRMVYEPIYWCFALGIANRYLWGGEIQALIGGASASAAVPGSRNRGPRTRIRATSGQQARLSDVRHSRHSGS